MRLYGKVDAKEYMKTINDFDLSSRSGRYMARKAGFDVAKQKPGSKRLDFEHYIDKTGDCWSWLDRKNDWGYGIYTENAKTVFAHREMYRRHVGDIPSGLVVLHKCDNPACCNPSHLSVGTHRDNQLDKVSKNRQAKGDKNGSAILSSAQVIAMREIYSSGKVTYKQLADLYEVCKDTAQKAIRGISWGHL